MRRGAARRGLASALALGALAACDAKPAAQAEPVQAPQPTSTASAAPLLVRKGPCEIVSAPEGDEDAAAVVKKELDRAKADKKDLLVYVGATWCEPCQRLHKAVVEGQLDADFPGLRLVEFDADRDDIRLRRAGYLARMIPMLAVPRDDGTASGKQVEGGVKGPAAVGQLRPRLRALVDQNLR